MTWADFVTVLVLCLIGVGGYSQGFIRGTLRLLALLSASVVALLLAWEGAGGTAQTTVVRAGLLAVLALFATLVFAWLLARAIPRWVHRHVLNRLLGILPALAIGLLVVGAVVGLAERLATTTETQDLLRRGLLTGRMVAVVDIIEQTAAGLR